MPEEQLWQPLKTLRGELYKSRLQSIENGRLLIKLKNYSYKMNVSDFKFNKQKCCIHYITCNISN